MQEERFRNERVILQVHPRHFGNIGVLGGCGRTIPETRSSAPGYSTSRRGSALLAHLIQLGSAVRPRLVRIIRDAENVLETPNCMRRTGAEPALSHNRDMTPAEQFTARNRPKLDVARRGQIHCLRQQVQANGLVLVHVLHSFRSYLPNMAPASKKDRDSRVLLHCIRIVIGHASRQRLAQIGSSP
jgi:hypothetical protein